MTSRRSYIGRLGLGTAQFGSAYGLTNHSGRVPRSEAERILELAAEAGIRWIDTAHGYGESEVILGELLPPDHKFRVVTKTPGLNGDVVTRFRVDQIQIRFEQSLKRLRQNSTYALLLHDADDLLKPGGELIVERLHQLKDSGLVTKVGYSAYTAAQIDAISGFFTPDIVQAPCSMLDQRLIRSGQLADLNRMGVEIHVRSVFLQGLLLSDAGSLDVCFAPAVPHLEKIHRKINGRGLSPVQASLQFTLQNEMIDAAVVGVCRRLELDEILTALNRESEEVDWSDAALEDEAIVDPRQWRLTGRSMETEPTGGPV